MLAISDTLKIFGGVLGVVSSAITIIGFFGKPTFPNRYFWLILTLLIGAALFYLHIYPPDNKDERAENHSETLSIDTSKNLKQRIERPRDTIIVTTKTSPTYVSPEQIIQPIKVKEVTEEKKQLVQHEIKAYINNLPKSDVAIVVVDNNIKSIPFLSSKIAGLYHNQGHSVNISLFTNDFLNSDYLTEVQMGNSKIIDELELPAHANYVVIGKYSQNFDKGESTTWVCRAKLEVSIISCTLKRQIDGFQITASNGFDDQQNAENGAREKILSAYKNLHSNL